jgi:glutaredoxin
MTNAIIWTQNRNLDCVKAVNLASRMGLTVEVRNIDSNQWDLAKFQAAVPGAKTLPQIVIGDAVLGGFKELVAKGKEQQAATPKVKMTKEERVEEAKSKGSARHEAKKASISDKMQAYAEAKANAAPKEKVRLSKSQPKDPAKVEARIAKYAAVKARIQESTRLKRSSGV